MSTPQKKPCHFIPAPSLSFSPTQENFPQLKAKTSLQKQLSPYTTSLPVLSLHHYYLPCFPCPSMLSPSSSLAHSSFTEPLTLVPRLPPSHPIITNCPCTHTHALLDHCHYLLSGLPDRGAALPVHRCTLLARFQFIALILNLPRLPAFCCIPFKLLYLAFKSFIHCSSHDF